MLHALVEPIDIKVDYIGFLRLILGLMVQAFPHPYAYSILQATNDAHHSLVIRDLVKGANRNQNGSFELLVVAKDPFPPF
jgi:hypothetical protein